MFIYKSVLCGKNPTKKEKNCLIINRLKMYYNRHQRGIKIIYSKWVEVNDQNILAGFQLGCGTKQRYIMSREQD